MSVQGDIESYLATLIEGAISDLSASTGPRVQSKVEGTARYATVFQESASINRLEWGQNDITERYTVIVFWSSTIARATRITEWEAFTAALLADQYLAISITGLIDSWLVSSDWSEGHDSGTVSITATVAVRRID